MSAPPNELCFRYFSEILRAMKTSHQHVDVHMLQRFADLAGLAINKSSLYEENLRLERTDRETGLEKYPPFLEGLNAVASRAFELGAAYAVLILDVDNFKDTANTFGYDASRELLKQIGQLVKDTLRPIDAAGRYGFDGFIIMLENTDMECALGYARRLLQQVESQRFTSGASTPRSVQVLRPTRRTAKRTRSLS